MYSLQPWPVIHKLHLMHRWSWREVIKFKDHGLATSPFRIFFAFCNATSDNHVLAVSWSDCQRVSPGSVMNRALLVHLFLKKNVISAFQNKKHLSSSLSILFIFVSYKLLGANTCHLFPPPTKKKAIENLKLSYSDGEHGLSNKPL